MTESTATQCERVHAALEAAGARGITSYDFATRPPDGGHRIMRVAARILDLKNRHGVKIGSAGRRDGHKVYVLAEYLPPLVADIDRAAARLRASAAEHGSQGQALQLTIDHEFAA